jgi:MoaA/NifB/PqqE/SkfB family radical SAM enzyme
MRILKISFPGDEKDMGGCLAGGRGFFHISPSGDAEPCPFSPFSEMNLAQHTLTEVLQSSFFEKVQKISAAYSGQHMGGCTLFEHKAEVSHALKTP